MTKKIGNIGQGGSGLSEGHQSGSNASLKDILVATRDEISSIKSSSAVTQANPLAVGATYSQAEVQAIADLAIACKAALNLISTQLDKFEK
jgi:hypothetical protein